MKVRIFLASSAELDEDKNQVEIFISRINKDWHEKRIYLELTTWKDFKSAITEGRSQDEYNKYIRSSDISIFLFHTKIGQFTKEEFDQAHKAFLTCKDPKKPKIYTYFKKEQKESQEITNFRDYIDGLDHFYDTYINIEDLFVKLNRQLNLLEKDGIIIKSDLFEWDKYVKKFLLFLLSSLTLLATGFIAYNYFQPSNLTVKVEEPSEIPGLPFQQGELTLVYGDKTESLPINNNEVSFKQIPFGHKKLKLLFKAKGYQNIDTILNKEKLIVLPIRRDKSLSVVFGSVIDENQNPIEDVIISLKDLSTKTDKNGKFRINIPPLKQAEEQRITAFKSGFQLWDFTGPASQTEDWNIIFKK